MRATIALRNIIRVAEHVFLVAVVPLQRHLDTHAIVHDRKIDHAVVDWRLVTIEVLDERLDAALILKRVLSLRALVDQANAHARVQKRQLAKPLCQDVEVKLDIRERVAARLEANCGARALTVADRAEWRFRLPVLVFLLMDLAIAMDGQHEVFR